MPANFLTKWRTNLTQFLFADAFARLGEKTTVMSPELLVAAGVPCCRCCQWLLFLDWVKCYCLDCTQILMQLGKVKLIQSVTFPKNKDSTCTTALPCLQREQMPGVGGCGR